MPEKSSVFEYLFRKLQIEMLKRQYKLRKKMKKWRDLQLDHFGFKRTQMVNRPFVYSHIPGPLQLYSSLPIF